MVIGLLVLTSIPTVSGVSQAISAQRTQDQRRRDERRMKKFNIRIACSELDPQARGLNGARIVLIEGKAYIEGVSECQGSNLGYVAEAFYIEYPDNERIPIAMGLVSQVQDDPPMLNWIYVDKHTGEVKYGNKTASIAHHVGSWDWTENEELVTLERADGIQTEQFVAVFNKVHQRWQLIFDMQIVEACCLISDRGRVNVNLRRDLVA